jgi:polyisoprenoid-binding protein YceI
MTIGRKTTALALAVVLAGGTVAGLNAQPASPPQMPGMKDASRVAAGTYRADPEHTLVEWSVSHFGFNPYYGLFGEAEGTLVIDPADISATRLDVTVPVTSLAVVSEQLREHMLRPGTDGAEPDFFGPSPEPARFVTTEVRRIASDRALAIGNLTLNGVTNEIAMTITFTGAGTNPMNQAETIGFTGEAAIMRSDFGMPFAVPLISDEVELQITAAFERQ